MWNQLPGYAVVCTCLLVSLARAEEATTKSVLPVGTIRQVTLYRRSALVTREIAVPPGESSRTLDVPDLPELVIADSVYADGDENTVVRAVRVSNSPAVESQRQEVRDLDRQLEELKQQRAELQVTLGVIAKNMESLDQMCRFSFAAGQVDLNRGLLNAETLTGLTTFSMNQHRELASEQLRCQTQLETLGKQLQLTKAKREQATGTPSATKYETKIFVETPGGAAGNVYLSYEVGNCGWTPQYTVRGRLRSENL